MEVNTYGDGEDGDIVLKKDTTLTKDKFFKTITEDDILGKKIIKTNGYRVYIKKIIIPNQSN